MRWRDRLALALCLGLLAGCVSTSSQPDLKHLGLQISDLPAATRLDSARSWSNAQAARRDHVAVSVYEHHGRITAYQTSFRRSVMNGTQPTWLLHADSEIAQYQDVAGARWGFQRLRSAMRKGFVWSATTLGTHSGQAAIPAHYRPLAVPRVGDGDAGFTVNSGGDEFAFTTRVLVFQRSHYTVMLRVMGLLDEVAVSHVVALARAIDRRIQAKV